MKPSLVVATLIGASLSWGCLDATTVPDAGTEDSGSPVVDAGPIDAGQKVDAGPADAGPADAGPTDAGGVDGGEDGGSEDAGPPDAGPCEIVDAGPLDPTLVAQGRALVIAHNCTQCHGETLSGNQDGVVVPGTNGVRQYPPNLTPDPATGLGCWTNTQIETAFLFNRDNNNAPICPPMPHFADAGFTETQAESIVAFLRSLPTVVNNIPSGPDCSCDFAQDCQATYPGFSCDEGICRCEGGECATTTSNSSATGITSTGPTGTSGSTGRTSTTATTGGSTTGVSLFGSTTKGSTTGVSLFTSTTSGSSGTTGSSSATTGSSSSSSGIQDHHRVVSHRILPLHGFFRREHLGGFVTDHLVERFVLRGCDQLHALQQLAQLRQWDGRDGDLGLQHLGGFDDRRSRGRWRRHRWRYASGRRWRPERRRIIFGHVPKHPRPLQLPTAHDSR